MLQPSLAFCFSLQPYRPGLAKDKLKQNANEGCDSCAILAGLVLCFIACFVLLVIALLESFLLVHQQGRRHASAAKCAVVTHVRSDDGSGGEPPLRFIG